MQRQLYNCDLTFLLNAAIIETYNRMYQEQHVLFYEWVILAFRIVQGVLACNKKLKVSCMPLRLLVCMDDHQQ